MSNKKNHSIKIAVGIVICCIFSTLTMLAILNRQYILDQLIVWQFSTTDEVKNLVVRAGMNDYGKFLYLASEPSLDSTQNFNTECSRTESVTSILGCYRLGRIYLYDIKNEDLDGIRETTAAHETLHAAYARMSDSEKNEVNALIEAEYKKLENLEDYKKIMEYYAKAEPGQRDNELHSIIGTEVADISSELEVHYSKYFSDRQKVVGLCKKYKSVFEELDNKAASLSSELTTLVNSINKRVLTYNSDTQILNSDIVAFNLKADSGGFTTQAQFNYTRTLLSNRISALEELKSSIESDMTTYQAKLKEYNAIATESEKLNNSIDSTFAPVPSV